MNCKVTVIFSLVLTVVAVAAVLVGLYLFTDILSSTTTKRATLKPMTIKIIPTTTQTPQLTIVSVDGEWGMWGPYTDCSVTCGAGGEKTRNRMCDSPVPEGNGLICKGNTTDIVMCNEGVTCPDCARICATGTLNINCTLCECINDIRGTVKFGDIGLSNVNIIDTNQQWKAIATTDSQGSFIIRGYCSDSLLLMFVKQGYGTTNPSYPVNSPTLAIVMHKIVKPEILLNPTPQVAYLGDSLKLKCEANNMDNIEWFLNGEFLKQGSLNGQESELVVTDPGKYKCRAVSNSGKIFSTDEQASFISPEIADSCSGVHSKYVALQPTCTYTDQINTVHTMVDLGSCGSESCISSDTRSKTERKCCVAVEQMTLQIVCDGFSYEQLKITKCGCSMCPANDHIVIRGKLIGDSVNFLDEMITVTGFETAFIEINYLHEFSFVITSKPIITLQVSGKFIMKQLVTIEPQRDVTEYNVVITVTEQPYIQSFNSETGGVVVAVAPSGLSLPVSINIPPYSFQLKDGNIHNGDVRVYAVINDPRNADSIMSASAQFTFIDDEGISRLLQTFGVVTLVATTVSNQPLEITGQINMTLNADDLGIGNITGPTRALLWSVNIENGNWQESANLKKVEEEELPKIERRRKRQTQTRSVKGTVEIPNNLPWINIDRKLLKDRCYISLKVTVGPDFIIPIGGIVIVIYIYENEILVNRMRTYSNDLGFACVPVVCGLDHVIEINSKDQVLVHPTHNLPTGFEFTNMEKGFKVKVVKPVNATQDVNGPIHRNANSCANRLYHFQLGKPLLTIKDYGDINVVEPKPNKELSWQPNSAPNYTVCALSFGFTSSDVSLGMVGKSYNSEGQLYGTFSAKLKKTDIEAMIDYVACVLVRCPTTNYTDVELQIASPIRQNCTLTENKLKIINSVNTGVGPLNYISYTDASYILRINTFDLNDGNGRGIRAATETTLELARFKALRQCEAYTRNTAADYTCGPPKLIS